MRIRSCAGIVLLAASAGCHDKPSKASCVTGSPGAPPEDASYGLCRLCAAPRITGTLQSSDIAEASGMVASAVHEGVFFLHNDSGDRARFFAVDRTGADLGSYDVTDAGNDDWEDIARAPCGRESCLYLGDLGGGKSKKRRDLVVYRVVEPPAVGPGGHRVSAEVLPLSYPDGAHDAETLLVHPTTGVVTIVSKVESGASSIYEVPLPLTPRRNATLVKVGEVAPPCGSPELTGGDVHPAGLGVLLRSYSDVFFYPMASGDSVAHALARPPCALATLAEDQGEAVAWLADGKGFATVGEGKGAPLGVVDCAAAH